MTFLCVIKLYGIINILKRVAESDQESNKVKKNIESFF